MTHRLLPLAALALGALLPGAAAAQLGPGPTVTRCGGALEIQPMSRRTVSEAGPIVRYQAQITFRPPGEARSAAFVVTFAPPAPVRTGRRDIFTATQPGQSMTVFLGEERGFAPTIPAGDIARYVNVECPHPYGR